MITQYKDLNQAERDRCVRLLMLTMAKAALMDPAVQVNSMPTIILALDVALESVRLGEAPASSPADRMILWADEARTAAFRLRGLAADRVDLTTLQAEIDTLDASLRALVVDTDAQVLEVFEGQRGGLSPEHTADLLQHLMDQREMATHERQRLAARRDKLAALKAQVVSGAS